MYREYVLQVPYRMSKLTALLQDAVRDHRQGMYLCLLNCTYTTLLYFYTHTYLHIHIYTLTHYILLYAVAVVLHVSPEEERDEDLVHTLDFGLKCK